MPWPFSFGEDMLVLESIGILCLLLLPGAIPVYCIGTFMFGFMDAMVGHVDGPGAATKRYQVYSLYRYGVRFHFWMTEKVK
jgi:hypothetical protein